MWNAMLSPRWQSNAAALGLSIVSLTTAGCGFSLNEARQKHVFVIGMLSVIFFHGGIEYG